MLFHLYPKHLKIGIQLIFFLWHHKLLKIGIYLILKKYSADLLYNAFHSFNQRPNPKIIVFLWCNNKHNMTQWNVTNIKFLVYIYMMFFAFTFQAKWSLMKSTRLLIRRREFIISSVENTLSVQFPKVIQKTIMLSLP